MKYIKDEFKGITTEDGKFSIKKDTRTKNYYIVDWTRQNMVFDTDGNIATFFYVKTAKEYIENYLYARDYALNNAKKVIEVEISEVDYHLARIIRAIEEEYPNYKFNRTENRYESCVIAIFEEV